VPAAEEINLDEDAAWLAELLVELDLIIIEMRPEDATQKRYWKGLRRDLSLLAQAARAVTPGLGASTLSAVMAAVETAIFLYHLQPGDR